MSQEVKTVPLLSPGGVWKGTPPLWAAFYPSKPNRDKLHTKAFFQSQFSGSCGLMKEISSL